MSVRFDCIARARSTAFSSARSDDGEPSMATRMFRNTHGSLVPEPTAEVLPLELGLVAGPRGVTPVDQSSSIRSNRSFPGRDDTPPVDSLAIIRRRLAAQRLAADPLDEPAEVVAWLGAVQAQVFDEAKWSVGERTRGCTDADVEAAFGRGEIVR